MESSERSNCQVHWRKKIKLCRERIVYRKMCCCCRGVQQNEEKTPEVVGQMEEKKKKEKERAAKQKETKAARYVRKQLPSQKDSDYGQNA